MKSINTTWTIWTARVVVVVVVVVVLTTGTNVIHRQAENVAIASKCLPGGVATKTRNKRNVFSSLLTPQTPSHSHSLPFNHWGWVDKVFLGAGAKVRHLLVLLDVNSCRSLKIAVCSSFSLPSPRIHSSFYSGARSQPPKPRHSDDRHGTVRWTGRVVPERGASSRHSTIQ